jgi:eukaryotic-like serine/threonine-protein kinase
VALNFLPQHLNINEEDKARFLQEAGAASAVTHTIVCVIHDIGEHNGNQVIQFLDKESNGHEIQKILCAH